MHHYIFHFVSFVAFSSAEAGSSLGWATLWTAFPLGLLHGSELGLLPLPSLHQASLKGALAGFLLLAEGDSGTWVCLAHSSPAESEYN